MAQVGAHLQTSASAAAAAAAPPFAEAAARAAATLADALASGQPQPAVGDMERSVPLLSTSGATSPASGRRAQSCSVWYRLGGRVAPS